jgi:hypothetical protein
MIPTGRRIFASFNEGDNREGVLSSLCFDLLSEQKALWPKLREGCLAQEAARVREIPCPGFTLKVQWNPQRIVSSAARIDPASIQARPCFLCRENLPDMQRAILYREEYALLCNPAPIFSQHYTIAHIHHRPQSIEPALAAFLTLMHDFSHHFMVFYNGPKSGASAPDHLHFQAAPADAMPVEGDIHTDGKRRLLKRMDGVDLFKAVGLGRAILVLEGADRDCVAAILFKVIAAMRRVFHTPDEPMLNLLGSYRGNRWHIMLFPRGRHRPFAYDREGDAQVLITPGSVEMGGLFITPREKDFHALDAALVHSIFQDVSVDEEMVEHIVDAL